MFTVEQSSQLAYNLDLDEVMKRAKKDLPNHMADKIDLLKKEYQKFLILAFKSLNSPVKFVCRPPPLIDTIWHTHILFTRQYDTDCKLVGGQFLHHTPESNDVNDKEKEQFFEDTKNLLFIYKQIFEEEAPIDIWPIPISTIPILRRCASCITCG